MGECKYADLDNGATCEYFYDCCDCGGVDCGCSYCWTCNACESCLDEG